MKATLFLVLIGLGLTSVSHAQDAPLTLTWQGTLTDAGGVAVVGPHDVTFQIYQAPQDGEPVWIERHVGLQIDNGNLLMPLGNTTPLPGDDPPLDPAVPLYLGVAVDDDAEMTPRMLIGGALRARWADRAGHALVADDVPGRDITPRTVAVGGEVVINQDGRWVGEPVVEDGVDGAEGRQGPQGDEGPQGEQGVRGEPGAQGDPGAQGAVGAVGSAGLAGEPGQIGLQGNVGPLGPQGRQGGDGAQGFAGICGEDQCAPGGPLTNLFSFEAAAQDTPIERDDLFGASGAQSDIEVNRAGSIADISVAVDIEHPNIGDLGVQIFSPDGRRFTLKRDDGADDGTVNFVTRLPDDRQPTDALDPLIGSPAAGTWTLIASDVSRAGLGPAPPWRIRSWSLTITRRSDDTWRLPANLVVEGALTAPASIPEHLCYIKNAEHPCAAGFDEATRVLRFISTGGDGGGGAVSPSTRGSIAPQTSVDVELGYDESGDRVVFSFTHCCR